MSENNSSPRLRFGITLALLARRWRRVLDDRLAAAGFTDATWTPLLHLSAVGGGISQKDLAARVGIDGSSLVWRLNVLSARGLIERRPDRRDRRVNRLHLTAAGRATVAAIRDQVSVIETEMLAALDDADIRALVSSFDRLDAHLREMLDE